MNNNSSNIPVPGMSFLNRLLGGGIPSGKLIGLVGPAGGGKTMLNLQVAYSLASTGVDVAYIYLDGGFDVLCRRFHTLTHGEFRSLHDDQETERRQQIGTQVCSRVTMYHQPKVDLKRLCGEIRCMNPRPRVVFIDQLGSWILNNNERFDHISIAKYCAALKEVAESLNITIVLAHQIRGAVKRMPQTYCPSAHDAQESKSFGDSLTDLCLFIGPADSGSNLKWMHCPQTKQKEIVFLDGANAQFITAGQPGEYFCPDKKTGMFLLTPTAISQGVNDIASVVKRLRGYWPLNKSEDERSESSLVCEDPRSISAVELLAAATLEPGSMTLEDGRMFVAWLERNSEMTYFAEQRFALWCRCNGRRDLLELLLPLPGVAIEDLAGRYSDEDLDEFVKRVMGRVHDPKALKELTNPLWLRKLGKVGDSKVAALMKRWGKELSDQLISFYQAHRFAAANQINYSKWRAYTTDIREATTNTACRRLFAEFVERDISPEVFLNWMKNRYEAIPWIASTSVWLDKYSDCADHTTLDMAHIKRSSETLLYGELHPWELAAYTLQTTAEEDLALMACLSTPQWLSMLFACIGNPKLQRGVETALCDLLSLSNAHAVKGHFKDVGRDQNTRQVVHKPFVMLMA